MDKEDQLILEIDANLFDAFWNTYGKKSHLTYEFIKKIFLSVDLKYKNFISNRSLQNIILKNLNVTDIAFYVCEEHLFHKKFFKDEDLKKLENNEQYAQELIQLVFDKLIYNDFDNVLGYPVQTKYAVEISTLSMFINQLFQLIKGIEIKNIKDKLLIDIFIKCFLLMKSTLNQLTDGLETEAMSSWRTLHELECVLKIIYDSNEEVSKAYFRHLEYGAYHRGEINNEKEKQRIAEQLQNDMEILQVKKSNKEKFINYGWLHWVSKSINDEEVKFNFLGGLQKLAQLTNYRKWYEIASDVTHSTPLLVYANKHYLYHSTLCITYESFFRIETLFFQYAQQKMINNPTYLNHYIQFKKKYKNTVETIYSLIIKDNRK